MNPTQDIPETEALQDIPGRTDNLKTMRLALASEVLRVPGTVSLRVGGNSMLPSLWPGDVIAVRQAQARDIKPGRLVVYALKDEDFGVRRAVRWDPQAARMTSGVVVNMFTVHRAVSCSWNALIARGDALPRNDPPVQFSRVYGEVVVIQRGPSRIIPKEQLSRPQKLFCFFLRRSHLLRRLVVRLHSLWQAMTHSQPSPECAA